MRTPVSRDAIVVSDTSFDSHEAHEIVTSNINFVNALFEEYLTVEELSPDALRSYYVDYYLAQVNNGGYSQFVYNSRWDPQAIAFIREGLSSIKAIRHLEVFEEGARHVERFGRDRLEQFFASEYFGENADRDELNILDDRFEQAEQEEDLLEMNAAWLKNHPNLIVLTKQQMREESRFRGQALPDREQRIARARANEPRYLKLIRLLCERAGQELDRVTAGDPTRIHEGTQVLAWHFLTNKGHHHMVESGGWAIMFHGHSTTERVCQIETPEE